MKKYKSWLTWWNVTFLLALPAVIQKCGRSSESYQPLMVSGDIPSPASPAAFSAVALVQPLTKQAFCSGTIIAPNLIVTASHCVFKKRLEDIEVMFGPSTDSSNAVFRAVSEKATYKKSQKYGSNFDIAWLKLKEPIPEGYRPIEIWHDPSLLTPGTPILIAGYGRTATKCSFNDASCQGGKLLHVQTKIQKFVNSDRLINLIVIGPQKMKGPCFGDSGGPAYIQYHGQWYLIGDFMGWDKVLVPENRDTVCDTGEAIYSFVGNYSQWIEESSGVKLNFQEDENPRTEPKPLPVLDQLPDNFIAWCEHSNYHDPSWYTIQRIIRIAAENRLKHDPDFDAALAFDNCDVAADLVQNYLSENKSLKIVGFNPKEDVDFSRIEDIRPLRSLSEWGMRELILVDHNITDLSPIESLKSLEKLEIIDNKISGDQINHFESDMKRLNIGNLTNLKELRINNPNIEIDLSDLSKLAQLRVVDLSYLTVESLAIFAGLPLEKLRLENIKVASPGSLPPLPYVQELILRSTDVTGITGDLSNLKTLNLWDLSQLTQISLDSNPQLESMIFYGLGIRSLPKLTGFPHLKELAIIRNRSLSRIEGIGPLPSINRIEIMNNSLAELGPIEGLDQLTELSLGQNQLKTIEIVDEISSLQSLELAQNQIKELSFLSSLPSLEFLDASHNPLAPTPVIEGLKNLKRLALENTKGEGLASLASLRDLPQLSEINIKSNSLKSLDPLIHFSNLEVILVSHNFITDVKKLSQLKNLQYLELIDNPLSDENCPIRHQDGQCRFQKVNLSFD